MRLRVYFNNAATGWPKFTTTKIDILRSLEDGATEGSRGGSGRDASRTIFNLRQMLSEMMKARDPHHIILCPSDTFALNTLIFGVQDVRQGDWIILGRDVHNAISRPVIRFAKMTGASLFFSNEPTQIKKFVRSEKNIRFAVFQHGCNVTGNLIHAERIGEILKQAGIPFILDGAQTLGAYPVDVEKLHVSAYTFAGHKALNGPQGTGGFYLRDGFQISPLVYGGTGTDSMDEDPPIIYPDSFEAGTPPVHDLIGLESSVNAILHIIGEKEYHQKLCRLAQKAHDALQELDKVIVYGDAKKRLPVVSFNIKGMLAKEVGEKLAKKDILCRTGIHCAASTVRSLGVLSEFGGTVRWSFGYMNSLQEIREAVKIVQNIARRTAK